MREQQARELKRIEDARKEAADAADRVDLAHRQENLRRMRAQADEVENRMRRAREVQNRAMRQAAEKREREFLAQEKLEREQASMIAQAIRLSLHSIPPPSRMRISRAAFEPTPEEVKDKVLAVIDVAGFTSFGACTRMTHGAISGALGLNLQPMVMDGPNRVHQPQLGARLEAGSKGELKKLVTSVWIAACGNAFGRLDWQKDTNQEKELAGLGVWHKYRMVMKGEVALIMKAL